MSKKAFEIDISQFEEMQELILEYLKIFTHLLNKKNLRIKTITVDADTDKVLIEAVDCDDDSDEDTEWDFEWI